MTQIDSKKIETLNSIISDNSTFVLVAHIRPDGDAIGSTIALREYLSKTRGKKATIIYPEPLPSTLSFMLECIDRGDVTDYTTDKDRADKLIACADVIFCMDCNSFSRTGAMENALRAASAIKILIDHHLNPDEKAFDLVFSEQEVSSASEYLYHILMQMSDIGGDASRIPSLSATAMMTGMTTDTNNFANSVYPSTFGMASALMAAGVDRDAILSSLYNNYRENRMRLMGWLLHDNMEITPEGIAFMVLDKACIDSYGIREGETEGFVNLPLSIGKVKMSIFLKEDGEGFFRVSVRSKCGCSANACAIRYFHGGGHEHASGGRLFFPLDIPTPSEAADYVRRLSHEFMGI